MPDSSDVSFRTYAGGKSFSILFAPATGTDGKQTSDITKQADLFPVGKRITVQYTATLNANAVIGQDSNPNKVNLTYSRNPNGIEQGTTEDHTSDYMMLFVAIVWVAVSVGMIRYICKRRNGNAGKPRLRHGR